MIGSKAPEFELASTSGELVRLADYKGYFVVLVFYPANDTPVCTAQLSEMNQSHEDFLRHGVTILGINTAPVEKTQSFCERRKFNFPVLADRGCKVAKQYDASLRWLPMVIRRTVVAVDPDGNICFYRHGKPAPSEVLDGIRKWAEEKGYVRG